MRYTTGMSENCKKRAGHHNSIPSKNSLIETFANNMGVIEDPKDIATFVREMHWDQWIKTHEALTMEYNPIQPYNFEEDVEQSDDRDINKSNESNRNETISNNTSIGVESTETGSVEADTTNNVINSGKDMVVNNVTEFFFLSLSITVPAIL